MLSIDYLGSKKSLFPLLNTVFQQYITKDTVFADLFAGTGVVGFNILKDYNCSVVSNDLQYYSYILLKANQTFYTQEEINLINQKIDEYNNSDDIADFFTENYAPPERMYFTVENARRIDAIRIMLEEDKTHLPEKVYFYLLGNLISSVSSISNVSCVYAAYLKNWKKAALKPLKLLPYQDTGIKNSSLCLNENICNILDKKYDIVYLDPPYNTRQYANYYHILETLALWDYPIISGITGMRDYSSQKSDFCSKAKVKEAFSNIIRRLLAKVIIVSYNDEGLLSHEELVEILQNKGTVRVERQKYKKFKAQQGIEREDVYEYIFVVEV